MRKGSTGQWPNESKQAIALHHQPSSQEEKALAMLLSTEGFLNDQEHKKDLKICLGLRGHLGPAGHTQGTPELQVPRYL